MRKETFWVATATVLAAGSAGAQSLPFPPVQRLICVPSKTVSGQLIVGKRDLAHYLVKKYPVNSLVAPEGTTGDIPIWLVTHPSACDDNKECLPSDKKNLEAADGELKQFLIGSSPGFEPEAPILAKDYFQGPDELSPVVCVQSGGKPVEAPDAAAGDQSKSKSAIRIRGKVDDLWIDRGDKPFTSASSANLGFASDGVAQKDTETLTGVIGYRIRTNFFKSKISKFDIIPYLQINHVIVSTDPSGTAKPSKTDTYDVGLVGSLYYLSKANNAYVVNLRPDFLVNRIDKSSMGSLNFQFIPYIGRTNSFWSLNSFIRFDKARDDFLRYKWIFDVRVDAGTYLDKGLLSVAPGNKDYLRAGGQFGIAITSDSPQLPLTFTSTYTDLVALSGDIDVGYFSNNLTYYFDPDKYLGLTLGYTNGRRQDTTKREQTVTAGLSGRF